LKHLRKFYTSITDFLFPNHLISMSESDYSNKLIEALKNNERTSIIYNIDKGTLKIDAQTYDIGRPSFSEMARTVLDSLKEPYGEYKTIPYTFNSSARI